MHILQCRNLILASWNATKKTSYSRKARPGIWGDPHTLYSHLPEARPLFFCVCGVGNRSAISEYRLSWRLRRNRRAARPSSLLDQVVDSITYKLVLLDERR